MIVSCYTMDLYCDREIPVFYGPDEHTVPVGHHRGQEFPHSFTGERYSECQRKARRRGWLFRHDGSVLCPRCAVTHRRGERKQKVEQHTT